MRSGDNEANSRRRRADADVGAAPTTTRSRRRPADECDGDEKRTTTRRRGRRGSGDGDEERPTTARRELRHGDHRDAVDLLGSGGLFGLESTLAASITLERYGIDVGLSNRNPIDPPSTGRLRRRDPGRVSSDGTRNDRRRRADDGTMRSGDDEANSR
mmetsp:Transcript_3318/g.10944  ORF Transcript_3318/g.10944 Transcript_3318/m.10944 type:complete len:158 (-) Transcript_3318:64-537(-)